jgi:hypothetical protein
MFKTSCCLILLMGLGGLWLASSVQGPREEYRTVCTALPSRCVADGSLLPTPASLGTAPQASSQGVDADGWPTPRHAGERLATECARASGLDPEGRVSPKQMRDMMTCFDLIQRALAAR